MAQTRSTCRSKNVQRMLRVQHSIGCSPRHKFALHCSFGYSTRTIHDSCKDMSSFGHLTRTFPAKGCFSMDAARPDRHFKRTSEECQSWKCFVDIWTSIQSIRLHLIRLHLYIHLHLTPRSSTPTLDTPRSSTPTSIQLTPVDLWHTATCSVHAQTSTYK